MESEFQVWPRERGGLGPASKAGRVVTGVASSAVLLGWIHVNRGQQERFKSQDEIYI